MLLMEKEGIRGVKVMLFIDIWKLLTNTWKIMKKIKNHDTLTIGI